MPGAVEIRRDGDDGLLDGLSSKGPAVSRILVSTDNETSSGDCSREAINTCMHTPIEGVTHEVLLVLVLNLKVRFLLKENLPEPLRRLNNCFAPKTVS